MPTRRFVLAGAAVAWAAVAASSIGAASPQQGAAAQPASPQAGPHAASLRTYCVSCHNERMKANYANLALDAVDSSRCPITPTSGKRSCASCAPASMPPAGRPRPDAGRARRVRDVARERARSRRRRATESRPHRGVPSSQPRRVPQRHSRPARARHRRRGAAAGRRRELRVRQHRGRAEAQPVADGAVPGGRARRSAARRSGPSAAGPDVAGVPRSPRRCRSTSTSKVCRSARAAACSRSTPSRTTASTRSPSICCAASQGDCDGSVRLRRHAPARGHHRRRAREAVHARAAQGVPAASRNANVARSRCR